MSWMKYEMGFDLFMSFCGLFFLGRAEDLLRLTADFAGPFESRGEEGDFLVEAGNDCPLRFHAEVQGAESVIAHFGRGEQLCFALGKIQSGLNAGGVAQTVAKERGQSYELMFLVDRQGLDDRFDACRESRELSLRGRRIM